jgi:two-component system, cell cycle sensor histidine kinase and response regulator CckA
MPTALVVDDEASVRRLICRILAPRGFVLHEAEDDLAACDVVQTLHGKLDLLLIVTDSMLLKLDGIALARKITAEYPAITVLYISGYMASPPKDHPSLAKPFTPAELVEMVETLLDLDTGHPNVANSARGLQMQSNPVCGLRLPKPS